MHPALNTAAGGLLFNHLFNRGLPVLFQNEVIGTIERPTERLAQNRVYRFNIKSGDPKFNGDQCVFRLTFLTGCITHRRFFDLVNNK